VRRSRPFSLPRRSPIRARHTLPSKYNRQFLDAALSDLLAGGAWAPEAFADYALPAPAPAAAPNGGAAAPAATPVTALSSLVRALFADALARAAPEATFRARLGKLPGVPAAAIDSLAAALYARGGGTAAGSAARGAARAAAPAARGGGATLEDFDWELSHSLASSRLAALGASAVRLSLRTREGGKAAVELDARELDATIGVLEAALGAAAAVQGSGGAASA
jgi:hypothetical protein